MTVEGGAWVGLTKIDVYSDIFVQLVSFLHQMTMGQYKSNTESTFRPPFRIMNGLYNDDNSESFNPSIYLSGVLSSTEWFSQLITQKNAFIKIFFTGKNKTNLKRERYEIVYIEHDNRVW